ncbi:MAG: glycosyltransferase family 4 protein [Syntrophales bacterium]|nr:glycosyltransferase family 4 protein [Syntrophales bacterium]
MRVLIMWNNFGPYHLARLRSAKKLGNQKGVDVSGLELAGSEDAYSWQPKATKLEKITLFPLRNVEEISVPAYIMRTWRVLQKEQPEVLAIAGYDHAAMLTALSWTKVKGKIAIFMSDSKEDDQPRRPWKEWMKSHIVRCFNAALVAGTPHKEYAVMLGLPPERIFTGYDVVDNAFFDQGARIIKNQQEIWRARLELPRPYILSVSRFIDKKNLFCLLEAYKKYRKKTVGEPLDLVLCGDGPLANRLKQKARGIPGVHFPGFKQVEDLIYYYGLGDIFILPSSHFEQWGLVVNEAMASGLPVLVSKACGCATDLVEEGVNGFTFDPYDGESLARLLRRMSSGEVDLKAMGEASRRIIAEWTPQIFAKNLFKAVEAALGA